MPNIIVTTRSGEVVEMFRLDGPLPSLQTLMKDVGPALRQADDQDGGRGIHGLGIRVRLVPITATHRRRTAATQHVPTAKAS